ncbi:MULTISPECIES: ATP-dependent protease subunit HslV [Geomicrobium]|uniref:ATP-dependent protease subunit HslV n=1 Tax=Geomicrobium sediminis TaxID=1347788 RepID=A0ABS2PB03_9BACL|nr:MULTISPECIES: ATP-dependent protease subunit HslV [Geomicrobium]EZH67238.1 ATP-dependent protease subunit HslV [Bacillaceae bacterium JMAK1]MBM7632583.1 ATP-dependent HslUV protease subunit HslV [Geomicrobium sediminis]GAK00310.1 ATP-dependent protease HslV [Geomicrobium sp. JCM 19055]GAK07518.1 ATP-dependent protease HslV [Geomicrobium sp. JCM 19038]
MEHSFHATTIFAIRHNGKGAMAGDGQVTFGQATVMKHSAKKIRRIYNGKVLAGFAGSVADAFTLFEMFEGKLQEASGQLDRAAINLAKEWRNDKVLRKLEAMLLVMNEDKLLLVAGTGEIIEPDDGMIAIGSGGFYALAAGRVLAKHSALSAKEIAEEALKTAGDICVYTNHERIIEEI